MEAVKRYGILTVGSVVLGISDYMFKFQNHFSFGGVSGIAVIMRGLEALRARIHLSLICFYL